MPGRQKYIRPIFHAQYRLYETLTESWLVVQYNCVVSSLTCPNITDTCSIGIPILRRSVAAVRRNR